MIELRQELAELLLTELRNKLGYYCEDGAVIGDAEHIIVEKEGKFYLAHKSEFETKGLFCRLKKNKI